MLFAGLFIKLGLRKRDLNWGLCTSRTFRIHSFTRCTEPPSAIFYFKDRSTLGGGIVGGYAFAGVWFTKFVFDG
jgi:hypothetical protein